MTVQFPLPAPDSPAEEWGRLAARIPGFLWASGMREGTAGALCFKARDGSAMWAVDDWLSEWCELEGDEWPDPDDPATAGAFEDLLGDGYIGTRSSSQIVACLVAAPEHPAADDDGIVRGRGWTRGRARIAAAAALGRWPGGAA